MASLDERLSKAYSLALIVVEHGLAKPVFVVDRDHRLVICPNGFDAGAREFCAGDWCLCPSPTHPWSDEIAGWIATRIEQCIRFSAGATRDRLGSAYPYSRPPLVEVIFDSSDN